LNLIQLQTNRAYNYLSWPHSWFAKNDELVTLRFGFNAMHIEIFKIV